MNEHFLQWMTQNYERIEDFLAHELAVQLNDPYWSVRASVWLQITPGSQACKICVDWEMNQDNFCHLTVSVKLGILSNNFTFRSCYKQQLRLSTSAFPNLALWLEKLVKLFQYIEHVKLTTCAQNTMEWKHHIKISLADLCNTNTIKKLQIH